MRGLALLIAAAVLAGCTAAQVEAPAPDPIRHDADATLTPQGWEELDFRMARGDQITVWINSTAPIAWDIHSHEAESRQVRTWQDGEGRVVESLFTAPADNLYSLYVRASGQTTRLNLTLVGQFALASGSAPAVSSAE